MSIVLEQVDGPRWRASGKSTKINDGAMLDRKSVLAVSQILGHYTQDHSDDLRWIACEKGNSIATPTDCNQHQNVQADMRRAAG